MILKVCCCRPKKMRFMQIESVLQTKNRSEPAKNWFSVALVCICMCAYARMCVRESMLVYVRWLIQKFVDTLNKHSN